MTAQPNQPIEVTAQHLKCAEEVIQWHHAHNDFLTANVVAEIIAKHSIAKPEQKVVIKSGWIPFNTTSKMWDLMSEVVEDEYEFTQLAKGVEWRKVNIVPAAESQQQQEKEVIKHGADIPTATGHSIVVSGGATAENNAQPSTETPRTDAWLERIGAPYGWDDFARTIERELSYANASIEEVIKASEAFVQDNARLEGLLFDANARIAELEKERKKILEWLAYAYAVIGEKDLEKWKKENPPIP